MSAAHPLVQAVVQSLVQVPPEAGGQPTVNITEEAASALSRELQALSSDAKAFQEAVREVTSFAAYSAEVLKSPDLTAVLLDILCAQPEVNRLAAAYDAEQAERATEVGERFTKFSGPRSAAETEIETTEPSISARDLLRGRGMNG